MEEPELAKTCVLLSHLVYEEFTLELEDRIRDVAECEDVHYLVNGPSHAFTAARDGELFVVFRGTGIRDRISLRKYIDIWFQLESEGGGRVHSRYARALNRLWDFGIQPKLAEAGETRIIFTGHSLGGALAVLAAGRHPANSRAVTFGCPRVGDRGYAKTYPSQVDRWVHGNDIIQYIPPPLPFLHFGSKHHLVRGRLKHPKTTFGEFICSCYALTGHGMFKRMMIDHHSWNYVKAVSEWADSSVH